MPIDLNSASTTCAKREDCVKTFNDNCIIKQQFYGTMSAHQLVSVHRRVSVHELVSVHQLVSVYRRVSVHERLFQKHLQSLIVCSIERAVDEQLTSSISDSTSLAPNFTFFHFSALGNLS